MSAKLFDHLEKTPPKITSSGIFISDPRVEEKNNIEVLLKGQSFPLKFVGIYPNRVLQLDLQEVEGLIDATGDDDTFETACKIHLNSMADWHINNIPTIQLQIHRRNAPFTAKLSNHLMARGVKKPASIRAKLANHRASARLIIQFINTDTQESEKSSLEIWKDGLSNVMPHVEVRSRRIGGATFQIPHPVREDRRVSLGMKWMIGAARKRNEKTMQQKLAGEIMAGYKEEGAAYKKKQDTHKMAEANKAFSHFRF